MRQLEQSVCVGELIQWKDAKFKITHNLDLNMVLGSNIATGESTQIPISEIKPISENIKLKVSKSDRDFSHLSEEEWKGVEKKYQIIEPLLKLGKYRSKTDVINVAKKCKKGVATIYRWIANVEATGRASSLARSQRSDIGKSKISKEADNIISNVIENYYLAEEKPNIAQAYELLKLQCFRAKVKLPGLQTLTRRIKAIKPKTSNYKRLGKDSARLYDSSINEYNEPDFPLACIQIDHTPVDLMFVDEVHRESVGRAYLTVAIDVYSRMVCGYYLSYDAPSAASVGFCLSHAILSKNEWLARNKIETTWPIWGLMRTIHADNGSDFRSNMIDRVCLEYDIHMNWRPLSKPNFGGHIERLLGTFNKDIHTLPGSTHSNISARGSYKSEEKAIFTLAEFEIWLVTYITKIYHEKLHKGIKSSPIKKYEDGILGVDGNRGCGLPPRIVDEKRLKLDFLPGEYRTVQRYGVAINDIFYYDPSISKYIKYKEGTSKHTKKFLVKQDPRDITVAYFYDDYSNEYIELRCTDRTAPTMNLSDLKKVRAMLKDKGESQINQQKIFLGYEELIDITEKSKKITKSIRRSSQKRKESSKKNKAYFKEPVLKTNELEEDIFEQEVTGFDDIEYDDD